MTKPDAERRREADARKRESGLIRVSVWVRKENKARLQKLAKELETGERIMKTVRIMGWYEDKIQVEAGSVEVGDEVVIIKDHAFPKGKQYGDRIPPKRTHTHDVNFVVEGLGRIFPDGSGVSCQYAYGKVVYRNEKEIA